MQAANQTEHRGTDAGRAVSMLWAAHIWHAAFIAPGRHMLLHQTAQYLSSFSSPEYLGAQQTQHGSETNASALCVPHTAVFTPATNRLQAARCK